MDEKTKKLIKERFDALPENIKQVLLSSDYEKELVEIGKLHQLTVAQLGGLELETSLVMMGLAPTKDFESSLTRELNIDSSKGNLIARDINEKIFLKIRELLKIMNNTNEGEPSLDETKEQIVMPTETANNNDTQILNSAGIEIIDEKPKTVIVPEKLELTGKTEVHPILAQKLTGFSKNTVTETDHSIKSIAQKSEPVADTSTRKVDPYREIPE